MHISHVGYVVDEVSNSDDIDALFISAECFPKVTFISKIQLLFCLQSLICIHWSTEITTVSLQN